MSQKNVAVASIVAVLIVVGTYAVFASANPGDFLYPFKAYFSHRIEYVARATDDIEALTSELRAIDARIVSGTLSTQAAAESRTRIVEKLHRIQGSVAAVDQNSLTPEMRESFSDALARLSETLSAYQGSLVKLDRIAAIDSQAQDGISTPLLDVVAETNEAIDVYTGSSEESRTSADRESTTESNDAGESSPDVHADGTSTSTEGENIQGATTTTDDVDDETKGSGNAAPSAEQSYVSGETAQV